MIKLYLLLIISLFSCVNVGWCNASCSPTAPCTLPTQKCSNGMCVAKTEAELSATVFSCTNDSQCSAAQKCSIPSGSSSGTCIARTCSDAGVTCPSNASICTNLGSGAKCNPGDMTCITPTCQVSNCANDPVASACPSRQKCVVTKGVGACVSKTCAELGGLACATSQICVDPDKNTPCSANDASCAAKAVCKAADCRNGGVLCNGTTPVCDADSGQCVAPNCSNGGTTCDGGKVCVDTKGHLCVPGKSCKGAYCQAIDCATGAKCADDEVCSDAISYRPSGSTSKGSYHKCNVVWCNSGDGICADTHRKCVNRSTCFLKTCADSNGPKCGANQICNNGTCQTICVGTGSTACPTGQICTSPSTHLPCLSGTCVFGVCQLPHCLNGGPTCLPGNKCQINGDGSGRCVPLTCADPNGTPCANGTVCRLIGGSGRCVNAVKTCADAEGDPCDAASKCNINTDLSGVCVSKLA